MAVTYGFFNSVNGDRKYNAEQMSEYFRGIINEGVYQHLDGGLAVTAGTGLAVNVAAGRAIIQNRWIQNSAAMSLTIAAASKTYARKDAVVIRLNWSSRSISIAVKTGTPAASPVAPSMTRNSTTYEMALAYVNVAANATSVTVTDKRSDSTVCGWVTVAQSTSGEVDAMLNAMKTGFDGVVYPSPAAMVQGSDEKIIAMIGDSSLAKYGDTVTFEQGALQNLPGHQFYSCKSDNSNRIRSKELYGTGQPTDFYISFDKENYEIVVYPYDAATKQKSIEDGSWKTVDQKVTGAEYIAIAVKNKAGTAITPSADPNIRITSQIPYNAYEQIKQINEIDRTLSETVKVNALPITGMKGTYKCTPNSADLFRLTNDPNRVTVDLRGLYLQQGDFAGLTDYSTYVMAFGDNNVGWFVPESTNSAYNDFPITANDPTVKPAIALVKRIDNANIADSEIDTILSLIYTSKKIVDFSNDFRNKVNKCNNNFLHFSFDDVGICINNLASEKYFSLWEEPFFRMMKGFHEKYGAVFSLYLWDISYINSIPARYMKDFKEASGWLKLGFHAAQEGSLADTTAAEAKTQYDTFTGYVFAKCGGVNSIDRCPRLNYFAGNLASLQALRDTDCGCIGFLASDDDRNAYYLNSDQLTYLRTHSLLTDKTNGLQFMSTVMRLDWFVSGFSSQYHYNTPVEDNPYDELVYRYAQPNMADLYANLVVFTHEWQTYGANGLISSMVEMIDQVFQFGQEYGYDFDYPQNRIQNVTSYTV